MSRNGEFGLVCSWKAGRPCGADFQQNGSTLQVALASRFASALPLKAPKNSSTLYRKITSGCSTRADSKGLSTSTRDRIHIIKSSIVLKRFGLPSSTDLHDARVSRPSVVMSLRLLGLRLARARDLASTYGGKHYLIRKGYIFAYAASYAPWTIKGQKLVGQLTIGSDHSLISTCIVPAYLQPVPLNSVN